MLAAMMLLACRSPREPDRASAEANDAAAVFRAGLDSAAEAARWYLGGRGYDVSIALDADHAYRGAGCLRMSRRPGDATPGSTARAELPAGAVAIEAVRGHELALSAMVRTRGVAGGDAALWIRVDRPAGPIITERAIDGGAGRSRERGPAGASRESGDRGSAGLARGWTRLEVSVPVPRDATAISFGAVLRGDGTAWIDELALARTGRVAPAERVAVAGTVRTPDGTPAAGALVAFVPTAGDRELALVETDPDGEFRVGIRPGHYAITASAPGYEAAYRAPAELAGATPQNAAGDRVLAEHRGNAADSPADGDAGGFARSLAFTLGAGGVELAGQIVTPVTPVTPVTLAADRANITAGAFVRARRTSKDGGVFFAPVGPDGRFALRVPAADAYVVSAHGARLATDEVAVPGRAGASPDEHAAIALRGYPRAVVHGPAPAPAIAWMSTAAIPLATAEAGSGTGDLAALASVVGDARVVSLGEATHGTREFFQLKHRVLEFLVERLGFTVFAIEANFSESLAIDHYVLTGEGDPAEALAGLYFWTWNTEEVLALIEWMRRYNADPKHRDRPRLRFYGIDMQFTPVAVAELLDYLRRVDPARARSLDPVLDPIEQLSARNRFAELPPRAQAPVIAAIARTRAALDARRDAYVRKSDMRSWQLARRHAEVIDQALTLYTSEDGATVRDAAMADNLRWILATEPPGTRVVAWAHNAHVSRARYEGVRAMGSHLRAALGDDHVSIGFAFDHGGFRAIDWSRGRGEPGGIAGLEVPPAPSGYLGAELARTGLGLFALDLRAAPPGSPADDWLHAPHPVRAIDSIYARGPDLTAQLVPADHYDVMVFVSRTSSARPNPKPTARGKP